MDKFQLVAILRVKCTILLELSHLKAFLDIFKVQKPRGQMRYDQYLF